VKPLWIVVHGLMTASTLVLLAILGRHASALTVLVIAGATFVYALVLNANYARALAGGRRSLARARGDRVARNAVLIACLPPLVYATLATRYSALRPGEAFADNGIRFVVALVFVAAVTVIFASTLTDWYLIRPWRDGVVRRPPCRRDERELWVDITRAWLQHRLWATLGLFVALWLVAGLMWFEIGQHWGSSDWVFFLLALTSPSLLAFALMRSWMAEVPTAFGLAFGNLSPVLGDWVEYDRGRKTIRGFIYDVSIDKGYRVIDRNFDTNYLSLTRSKEIEHSRPPTPACEQRCEMVEGVCDYRKERVCQSQRWLVI
jgi:hypothetical protein